MPEELERMEGFSAFSFLVLLLLFPVAFAAFVSSSPSRGPHDEAEPLGGNRRVRGERGAASPSLQWGGGRGGNRDRGER